MKLGNVESSFLQIVCGVPQGSTLGPLLFLLYINDLANSSDVLSFRLFADDANIFYATKTSKDLEAVMNDRRRRASQGIRISLRSPVSDMCIPNMILGLRISRQS